MTEKNTRRSLNPKPGARARVVNRLIARRRGVPYQPWSHEKSQDFPMDERRAALGKGDFATQFARMLAPAKPKRQKFKVVNVANNRGQKGA